MALRGADRRRRMALADAAQAAWIGAHADRDGLMSCLRGLDEGPRKEIAPEAWGKALESMKQTMAVISMDDYRARLRGHPR